ncbi:MAG: polysaccharide biosynthesis C-terminal domain-containing protein [Saprospiraceae bacterium]
MKREFVLNLLFLLLINILIKPLFIFGIDLGVQNRIGSDYGLYFALLNLAYLGQIVNDFGLQSYNQRLISQDPHLLDKYMPRLLAFKLALGVAYAALTLLVAVLAAGYEGRALGLLAILIFNQILLQLSQFLRTAISGLGYYRLDSALSALDKLLMLPVCGVLLFWPPLIGMLSAETFALGQTLALLLGLLVVYFFFRKKTGRVVCVALPDRRQALLLWRQTAPYALAILLMTAYTRLDAVLLERLTSTAQAEIYAGAFRLLDAGNMLGFLFASLLLPMFSRMLGRGEAVASLLGLSARMIFTASYGLTLAVFFFREEWIALMMPLRANPYRAQVLGVLFWAFLPMSLIHVFSALLTARGLLMRMSRFFVWALLLDVSLNLLLTPRYEALGAAVATLSVQSFVALGLMAMCRSESAGQRMWVWSVRLLAFAAPTALAAWLAAQIWQAPLWYWRFVVVILFVAIWGALVGWLRPPRGAWRDGVGRVLKNRG